MSSSSVAGKIALVTMSTSGICRAIADALGASGARTVIVNGRSAERCAAVCAELSAAHPSTEFAYEVANVALPADQERMYASIEQRFGGLDILVHSGKPAGSGKWVNIFHSMPVEAYQQIVEGYFLSFVHACRLAAPLMKARGGGAILSIASDAAKVPTPGEALVGGAFAANVMFAKVMALELGRDQIRVNVIAPSLVRETDSYARMLADGHSRKIFEKAEARAKLGLPTPASIAPMALLLVSDEAAHITGQVVTVNGGLSVS